MAPDRDDELIAYWLNAYNSTLRAELARRPRSGHLFRHRKLFGEAVHQRDGLEFTLDEIEHGLLRGNRRPPYRLRPLLRKEDPKLDFAPGRVDPRIHFALNCGARSCPPVRTYTADGLEAELEAQTLAYIQGESTLDRAREALTLPGVIKLYRGDFGPDAELLELSARALPADDRDWLRAHADAIKIRWAKFDWRMVPPDPAPAQS